MHSKKYASMDEVAVRNQETIALISPKKAAEMPGARFFFTTRRGGVSQGCYASLNLGEHVGDDPGAVSRNRARVAKALTRSVPGRADPGVRSVCYLKQVHGSTTVEAEPWCTPPHADALVTRSPGLVLAILTADCAPVLFVDEGARVVGAAHAGWRGSVAGVLESCLDAMIHLGAHRERIHAWIGPCIRQPSYPVDHSFNETFMANPENKFFPECGKFFSKQKKTGNLLFDLPGYIQGRLEFYGLLKERIDDVRLCTFQEENVFFSHRRATQHSQEPCGRQAGYIHLV